MMKAKLLVYISLLMLNVVFAENTPCSGKKGGISHCLNGKYICNDNSTSQSKKVCDKGINPLKK